MTTYITDNFTGSNGSALSSAWTTTSLTSGLNTTGQSATIQGNQGRWNAGSVTTYGGHCVRRYSGSNLADVEVQGKVTFTTSIDGNTEVWLRADTSAQDGTGYILQMQIGTGTSAVKVIRANGFVYTTLTSLTFTIAQNTQYGFRFYMVGTTLKVKIWATSGSEPGPYTYTTTDSAVGAAGYTYIHAHGGGSANFTVDYDDVIITDGTGNQFTFTGSVQPSGFFTKNVMKNPFTGSITPTGVLNKVKVVTKLLTGSITAAGALVKVPMKVLTGSIQPTGVKLFTMLKTFTGSITPSGSFRKSMVRVFTGTITAHGNLVTTFLGRVFGRPGIAAMRVYKAAEAFIRVRRN